MVVQWLPMQGVQVRFLTRELDPTCHKQDLMWPNKYHCPPQRKPYCTLMANKEDREYQMQLDPECKSAQPCWKGCGNQYPLALKNVYNLWPSNPIHRCTSNKSEYICVHRNICERFPVALFIHNGPSQKLPRCPSTLEQTNELGDHRT